MRFTERSHGASSNKARAQRLVSRRDLVASLVGIAIGLGVCIRGIGLTVGNPLAPQPGFFPFLGGLLLVSFATLLLLQSVWLGSQGNRETMQGGLVRPALVLGGLGIYAWLLELMGYPLMTTLIAILVLRVLDTRWLPAVLASVGLALGSFALFVKLGVSLPLGRVFGG